MPSKIQSIFLAGVAVGVISSLFGFIPVAGGCLVCLAYIAAGIVAVWHYTNTYAVTIPGGQGAGMGALAGLLTGVVYSIIEYVFRAVRLKPDYQEEVRRQLEASGMEAEQMDQIIGMLASPAFMVGAIVVGLIVAAILGAVGGAVGASLFKKGHDSVGSTPDAY